MLEAAILSQDKHRLQISANENNKNAKTMLELLSHTSRLLSALLICNTLANVTCAASATAIAVHFWGEGDKALLFASLIVTFIILICSEITPKLLGVRYAQPISLFSATGLKYLIKFLSPIINFVNIFAGLLLKTLQQKDDINASHSEKPLEKHEVLSMLRIARRKNSFKKKHQFLMVEKTLEFQEMSVEKIMTPRQNIKGINLQDDIDTISRVIKESTFSKLPIYYGNLDDVKGVIYTLDAMKKIHENHLTPVDLLEIAKPVVFVPAAATAVKQLQAMRQNKHVMGMIIDGSGGVIGTITFNNFSAAIIGEEKLPDVRWIDKNMVDIPTHIALSQLNVLDSRIDFPTTQANTLNGFLLEYIQDLPNGKFCVFINNIKIEAVDIDDKSIGRVVLTLPPITTENKN